MAKIQPAPLTFQVDDAFTGIPSSPPGRTGTPAGSCPRGLGLHTHESSVDDVRHFGTHQNMSSFIRKISVSQWNFHEVSNHSWKWTGPRIYVSISCERKHSSQERSDTVSNVKGSASAWWDQKQVRFREKRCKNVLITPFHIPKTEVQGWNEHHQANNYIEMMTAERTNRTRRENLFLFNRKGFPARVHHFPSKRKNLITR